MVRIGVAYGDERGLVSNCVVLIRGSAQAAKDEKEKAKREGARRTAEAAGTIESSVCLSVSVSVSVSFSVCVSLSLSLCHSLLFLSKGGASLSPTEFSLPSRDIVLD